ncbi:MAG: hypothetical protein JO006_05375 [Paucibacter sp.]|nr:hypothetical protein [Roseateles sp.]
MFGSKDAAQQGLGESAPACGGWVESSFDLHRGVEVTEDVGFEEFERLRALGPTPQVLLTALQERSRRMR